MVRIRRGGCVPVVPLIVAIRPLPTLLALPPPPPLLKLLLFPVVVTPLPLLLPLLLLLLLLLPLLPPLVGVAPLEVEGS